MFVDFNILNQLGSPSINSNTLANRPSAGQVGRLFVSTDTFEIYRDNGTGWDLIGGPGSSTVIGSGAAGQVTYWTGTNSVGGNNNLFWDIANERLGIGTTTPSSKVDIAGSNVLLHLKGGSNAYMMYHGNGVDEYQVGYTDGPTDYRRFSIYDQTGAKETITIDKQSRNVGVNYQYSSLADQPAYTFDVSGSGRFTDSAYFVSSGAGQVGINTTSPTATALVQANKTDGYGLYLNYTTNTGSGTTATALWTLNTTNGSGFSAVIEEKTPNTTGGQYPLAIKHSLTTGTAGVGMGTGIHFQLPDDAGNFKTTQLTIETTDAAAATYTSRYRFMAQVNNSSTPLAYLTSVGLGIGNVIPAYKLDVNGTVRAFGVGNTGNFLAVDTNPGGASVNLNPQYGTGLPILYTNGAFPLLFGTNNTEQLRLFTNGNFLIGTSGIDTGYKLNVSGSANATTLFQNGVQVTTTANISGTTNYIPKFTSANVIGNSQIFDNGNIAIGSASPVSIGAYKTLLIQGGSTSNGGLIQIQNSNSSCQAYWFNTDSNSTIKTVTNHTLILGANNQDFFYVNPNGNIGIATITPGTRLDVNGVGTFQTGFQVVNGGAGLSFAASRLMGQMESANLFRMYMTGQDASTKGALEIYNATSTGSPTIGLAITAASSVGIGTSTPINKFTVKTGSDNNVDFFDTGAAFGSGLQIRNDANTVFKSFDIYSSKTSFLSGNVLIGTTTDDGYLLQVNGTIKQANYTYHGNNAAGSMNGATWVTTTITLQQNTLGVYELYAIGSENGRNQAVRVYFIFFDATNGWQSQFDRMIKPAAANDYGEVDVRMTTGGVVEIRANNGVSTGLYRIVIMNQFKN